MSGRRAADVLSSGSEDESFGSDSSGMPFSAASGGGLRGYLVKRGFHNKRSWKKRWFETTGDGEMRYCVSQANTKELGRIQLLDAKIKPAPSATQPYAFEIVTQKRVWQLVAPDEEQFRAWLTWLTEPAQSSSEANAFIDAAEEMITSLCSESFSDSLLSLGAFSDQGSDLDEVSTTSAGSAVRPRAESLGLASVEEDELPDAAAVIARHLGISTRSTVSDSSREEGSDAATSRPGLGLSPFDSRSIEELYREAAEEA